MENFSTRQQAAALQSALGIRAQSAGQFCKKGSGQMRLMMLSSQRLTLSCKTFSNKVCKVCLEIANNTTDQHLHHSICITAFYKQPLYLLAFQDLGSGGVLEWMTTFFLWHQGSLKVSTYQTLPRTCLLFLLLLYFPLMIALQ